jgi:hypothetical protein
MTFDAVIDLPNALIFYIIELLLFYITLIFWLRFKKNQILASSMLYVVGAAFTIFIVTKCVIILFLAPNLENSYPTITSFLFYLLCLLAVFVVFFISTILPKSFLNELPELKGAALASRFALLFGVFMFVLYLYSIAIYPSLPANFGGGDRKCSQITLKDQSVVNGKIIHFNVDAIYVKNNDTIIRVNLEDVSTTKIKNC